MLKDINNITKATIPRTKHIGRVASVILATWSIVTPSVAEDVQIFDLTALDRMRSTDPSTLELILNAMHDAIFFTEESIDRPVICVSPVPLPLGGLLEAIDAEIAEPTHPNRGNYGPTDRVAFVYLNALKSQQNCQ